MRSNRIAGTIFFLPGLWEIAGLAGGILFSHVRGYAPSQNSLQNPKFPHTPGKKSVQFGLARRAGKPPLVGLHPTPPGELCSLRVFCLQANATFLMSTVVY